MASNEDLRNRRAPIEMSAEEYRAAGHKLVDDIADWLGSLRERPVNRDEEPRQAMERLGLGQVRDSYEIGLWVGEVLEEHPEPVAQFLEGKAKALGFLVGQVMKRSAGRADPQQAQSLLRESLQRLDGESIP